MKPRGRPYKARVLEGAPRVVQFSPRGRPGRPDEVELLWDHFEALRLADFRGLDQEGGAREMGVSRATFGRILREARKRAADALVNGKIVRIVEGPAESILKRPSGVPVTGSREG